MRPGKPFWVASTLTFLVLLTNGPAIAVSLHFSYPTTAEKKSFVFYKDPDTDTVGYTYTGIPKVIPQNGPEKSQLMDLLGNFSLQNGGNWNFHFAPQPLQGYYDITDYYACGPQTPCGVGLNLLPAKGGVGATMQVDYHPVGNDPQPGVLSGLQWIQVVSDNHPLYPPPNGTYGIPETILDISPGQSTPYYTGNSGDGYTLSLPPQLVRFFGDAPYRLNSLDDHYWEGQLYLAKTSYQNNRDVTIYSGFEWGWKNKTFQQNSCPAKNISSCNPNPKSPKVDLALVIDTTGSMGPYIDSVKAQVAKIVDNLFTQSPGSRVALVDYKDFPVDPYGDPTDYPYKADLPFSTDKASILKSINSLSIGGGNDIPESAYTALVKTIETENLGSWRNDAKKVAVIISDAPPIDPEPFTQYTSNSVLDAAYGADPVAIYSIVPGNDPDARNYFTNLSVWTGGKFYALDSTNNVGDALAAAIEDITGTQVSPSPSPTSPSDITNSACYDGGFCEEDPGTLLFPTDPNPTSVPEPSFSSLAVLASAIWFGNRKLKYNRTRVAK